MTALSARDAGAQLRLSIDRPRRAGGGRENTGARSWWSMSVEEYERLTGNKVAPSRLEGEE
ncbi:hypothetical protein [Jhaorihella thermophila]|uniref:hypothetical protein n=1 Tax=Jhaorihella thermophila TaxID=488547 RepID=UPI00360E06E0